MDVLLTIRYSLETIFQKNVQSENQTHLKKYAKEKNMQEKNMQEIHQLFQNKFGDGTRNRKTHTLSVICRLLTTNIH